MLPNISCQKSTRTKLGHLQLPGSSLVSLRMMQKSSQIMSTCSRLNAWWPKYETHTNLNRSKPTLLVHKTATKQSSPKRILINQQTTPPLHNCPPQKTLLLATVLCFHLLFASYNQDTHSINPLQLSETAIELRKINGGAQHITDLSKANTKFLNTVAKEGDYTSRSMCWPHSMITIIKGYIPRGQFCIPGICLFADGNNMDGLNVLALILPSLSTTPTNSFNTIREANLLLGKSTDNLTKVDTFVKINMDIQDSTGLAVCTNLVAVFSQLSIMTAETINQSHSSSKQPSNLAVPSPKGPCWTLFGTKRQNWYLLQLSHVLTPSFNTLGRILFIWKGFALPVPTTRHPASQHGSEWHKSFSFSALTSLTWPQQE